MQPTCPAAAVLLGNQCGVTMLGMTAAPERATLPPKTEPPTQTELFHHLFETFGCWFGRALTPSLSRQIRFVWTLAKRNLQDYFWAARFHFYIKNTIAKSINLLFPAEIFFIGSINPTGLRLHPVLVCELLADGFLFKEISQQSFSSVPGHVSLTTHLNKERSPGQQALKCCEYLVQTCMWDQAWPCARFWHLFTAAWVDWSLYGTGARWWRCDVIIGLRV